MNINKLFEGQRHDEEKIQILMEQTRHRSGVIEDYYIADIAKQYAEHFLVRFLDIEIERLEKSFKNTDYPDDKVYDEARRQEYGFNKATSKQITHLQYIKRQLTESKSTVENFIKEEDK